MTAEHDRMVYTRYALTRVIIRSLGQSETDAARMASQMMDDGDFLDMLLCEITPRDIQRYRRGAVLADFNGRNHKDVCRKHGISRQTLYRHLMEKSHNPPDYETTTEP